MSVEDDTELRDLLAQTLEANGCLAKIRAQLRASVFLALDDEEEVNKKRPLLNGKIRAHTESIEGKVMFCIVREFLEFFDLDFTISVFEPESYAGYDYKYEGRCKLVQDLKIPAVEEDSPDPVLLQLLRIAKAAGGNKIDVDLTRLQSTSCDFNLLNSKSSATTPSTDEVLTEVSSGRSMNSPEKEIKTNPNLNETFDVPSSLLHNTHKLEESSAEEKEAEDGSQRTAEISLAPDNSEKSDQSTIEADFSPPVLKDSKFSMEKLKKSNEKLLKPKNALCDFPPLQLNKSRSNDTMILPSLYSREFKDKCSPKENDKFLELDLDSLDNYEEDFMSGSDLDLSLSRSEFELKVPASPKVPALFKANETPNESRSTETSSSCSDNNKKNDVSQEKNSESSVTSENVDLLSSNGAEAI